jgi:hypothetical protein
MTSLATGGRGRLGRRARPRRRRRQQLLAIAFAVTIAAALLGIIGYFLLADGSRNGGRSDGRPQEASFDSADAGSGEVDSWRPIYRYPVCRAACIPRATWSARSTRSHRGGPLGLGQDRSSSHSAHPRLASRLRVVSDERRDLLDQTARGTDPSFTNAAAIAYLHPSSSAPLAQRS